MSTFSFSIMTVSHGPFLLGYGTDDQPVVFGDQPVVFSVIISLRTAHH